VGPGAGREGKGREREELGWRENWGASVQPPLSSALALALVLALAWIHLCYASSRQGHAISPASSPQGGNGGGGGDTARACRPAIQPLLHLPLFFFFRSYDRKRKRKLDEAQHNSMPGLGFVTQKTVQFSRECAIAVAHINKWKEKEEK